MSYFSEGDPVDATKCPACGYHELGLTGQGELRCQMCGHRWDPAE